MTSTCAIYCLNFNNEVRNATMKSRFKTVGVDAVLHPGVPINDPRIAGRGLIPHTEKCWSCMYGHLDMIRDFVENDSRDYVVLCEDDIMIDANFKSRLEHVIEDFDAMQLDTLLLGYLVTYPIVGETNDGFPKRRQSIYVDIDTANTTLFRYYDYGDIWGTQMYMMTRAQATRIVEKYANGYADKFLKTPDTVFPPFSADWSITKEGKRCIVYPMLAIEDGQTKYDDHAGQHEFHLSAHFSHVNASTYI
jgi:hypothetical protein